MFAPSLRPPNAGRPLKREETGKEGERKRSRPEEEKEKREEDEHPKREKGWL